MDQYDVTFLRTVLANDRQREDLLQRQRSVVLYDLQTNAIIAQGKNQLTQEELQKTPSFFSYTAQAKLFNRSFLNLQDQELEVLQNMTTHISATRMNAIINNNILKYMPVTTRRRFKAAAFGSYLKEQLIAK